MSANTFLCIIDLQNEQNIFLSDIYNFTLGIHKNVCAWTLKFPPSQNSEYLGTCALDDRKEMLYILFILLSLYYDAFTDMLKQYLQFYFTYGLYFKFFLR